MKLLVISNMAHYYRDGVVVGHGSTARELSEIAKLFSTVRHIACIHEELPPNSALPYVADNLQLVGVPPAGGTSLSAKLDILRLMPEYIATIRRELADADAVHVRCPANITLAALAVLGLRGTPRRRWVKYAGSWRPRGPEPWSYRLQREMLERGIPRAQVTVNGSWPAQPSHIHTFVNPCLTDDEIIRGNAVAAAKRLEVPIRLLFVGHLGPAKNPDAIVSALPLLAGDRVDAQLDVVGEGDPSRLASLAESIGCGSRVTLHGALPRASIDALYARAHFVVLPSRTEGWPKVLSEGMAWGAVPIATPVGSIPETLEALRVGTVLRDGTAVAISKAVRAYATDPERWRAESVRGAENSTRFGYTQYREAIRRLLEV